MYINVVSKLDKKISVTKDRWQLIVKTKHPELEDKKNEVQETLTNPDEIRLSKSDQSVYLYYKNYGKLSLVVVAKHPNGEGFIITSYFTDKIKEGKQIFERQS